MTCPAASKNKHSPVGLVFVNVNSCYVRLALLCSLASSHFPKMKTLYMEEVVHGTLGLMAWRVHPAELNVHNPKDVWRLMTSMLAVVWMRSKEVAELMNWMKVGAVRRQEEVG